MNPTPTETEKVETNLPTRRGVGSIRVREEIQGPDRNDTYISSFSSTRKLSRQDFVDGSRSVNPEVFLEMPPYLQRVIRFFDGSRSVNPEVFLEMPPSLQDVRRLFRPVVNDYRYVGDRPPSLNDVGRRVNRRKPSFEEPPSLSFGDLLDIPSAPSSPKHPQPTDQNHPLSPPQGPQPKNDTSAAGSSPNRPSGELVDKDSTDINNIADASSSLPRPQQLFDVVRNAIKEHKINIPSTSEQIPGTDSAEHATNTDHENAPTNLPCRDLLDNKGDYYNICVPLYEASITGNWDAAKVILDQHPKLVGFAITETYETALHVASLAEETKRTICFVENLVNLMTEKDLELKDSSYNTAFCVAAKAGNIKMIKVMLVKNPELLNIPGSNKMMPLYMSALFGKYETVKYLYARSDNMTGDFWTPKYRDWMLNNCVECDFYDVALKIMKEHPQLASNGSALEILARKPDAIFDRVQPKLLTRIRNSIIRIMNMEVALAEDDSDALKLLTRIWKEITLLSKDEVDNILRGPGVSISRDGRTQIIYPFRILFVAAKMGNTRFVIKLLQAHPHLIVSRDEELHTIFHVAVMNRQCDIHNLLYEIGAQKDLILPLRDYDGNNMLHLLGKTSVKMRSKTFGASLLMQRELLWFKEIETMMQPALRQSRNNAGQTPYELFSEENKDLVVQGLKWMKDCMVVATLIVTVAFAVAFTVPGGYSQENGIPIFVHGISFLVFVIADAISLFCSSTSLLVFLSILTSRHGQHDFMYALPTKLMIGLGTLLISVAAMMITFSASFFVLYDNRLKWVPILIATFAAMPVIVFAILQIPLLVDMIRSMYDSEYLFKRNRRTLYNRNLRL